MKKIIAIRENCIELNKKQSELLEDISKFIDASRLSICDFVTSKLTNRVNVVFYYFLKDNESSFYQKIKKKQSILGQFLDDIKAQIPEIEAGFAPETDDDDSTFSFEDLDPWFAKSSTSSIEELKKLFLNTLHLFRNNIINLWGMKSQFNIDANENVENYSKVLTQYSYSGLELLIEEYDKSTDIYNRATILNMAKEELQLMKTFTPGKSTNSIPFYNLDTLQHYERLFKTLSENLDKDSKKLSYDNEMGNALQCFIDALKGEQSNFDRKIKDSINQLEGNTDFNIQDKLIELQTAITNLTSQSEVNTRPISSSVSEYFKMKPIFDNVSQQLNFLNQNKNDSLISVEQKKMIDNEICELTVAGQFFKESHQPTAIQKIKKTFEPESVIKELEALKKAIRFQEGEMLKNIILGKVDQINKNLHFEHDKLKNPTENKSIFLQNIDKLIVELKEEHIKTDADPTPNGQKTPAKTTSQAGDRASLFAAINSRLMAPDNGQKIDMTAAKTNLADLLAKRK